MASGLRASQQLRTSGCAAIGTSCADTSALQRRVLGSPWPSSGAPSLGCSTRIVPSRHIRKHASRSIACTASPLADPSPAASADDAEEAALQGAEVAAWQVPRVTQAKRVVLVRHGESTWNAIGRIQGSSNFSALTEKGIAQAETSRQMLAQDTFDVCFHSPLQRSAKTADIIWGTRTAPMQSIDDLREIDLYSFQGLFKHEGKERYGAQYRMWQVDAANFEIDGHYPVRELWARARTCWDEVLASPAKSILVVAHNAVNQALVASAIGLGPEYFRLLLQSNCGVSVLDFTPSPAGTSTEVSLNRLNQTPSPPVGAQQSAGRKARSRVILVCHGATDSVVQKRFPSSNDALNMLGVVQSRKTSELLLDVRVDSIFASPCPAAMGTASAIYEVQMAADCLGADCIPRDVDIVPLEALRDLDYGDLTSQERPPQAQLREVLGGSAGEALGSLLERAGEAWAAIGEHLEQAEAAHKAAELSSAAAQAAVETKNGASSDEVGQTRSPEMEQQGKVPPGQLEELRSGVVVTVSHPMVIKAMVCRCLELGPEDAFTFAVDEGAICVVDFTEGSKGQGVVRCLNYTAHLGRWAVPVTSPTFFDESF